MNPKPTSYVLVPLEFLPVLVFAVTLTATRVSGTPQAGQTLTYGRMAGPDQHKQYIDQRLSS